MAMPPVSSETMMVRQSDFCEIPSPALCLSPRALGMSTSCATGRMHPAALMRLRLMTIAPSWRGEFLKKMFSMSRCEMLASMISPDSITSLSGTSRSMTMSAPTFCLAMLMHAMTMGMMSGRCIFSSLLFLRKNRMKGEFRWRPMVEKKLRISSWKSTMSASEPTLTSLSKMLPSSRISNTCVTSIQATMKVRTPEKMLALLDSFISL